MTKLDDKLNEFLKMVECCEWENRDYKKVPMYKTIKNDIIKICKEMFK